MGVSSLPSSDVQHKRHETAEGTRWSCIYAGFERQGQPCRHTQSQGQEQRDRLLYLSVFSHCLPIALYRVSVGETLGREASLILQTMLACIPLQVYPPAAHAASPWILVSSLCKLKLSGLIEVADVQRTFANLEEDVETEDAWELASRRASNISRHTSLHSVHPSPDHLRDLPITGPFGATTSASELGVDMAVEPEHTANGDPSPPVQLAAPLERQDTAVQPQGEPPQLRHSGSGTRPEAVQEQDEAIGTSTSNDTQLNTAPSSAFIFVPRDSFNTAPEETAAMPMNSNNPFLNSFSQAATPMNETFLSTLAPGMHQRLELAQAIESGSGPNAAEGAGGGVEEVNGDMMDMELDEQRMRTERSAPESSSALDEQQARARALRSGEVEDMAME